MSRRITWIAKHSDGVAKCNCVSSGFGSAFSMQKWSLLVIFRLLWLLWETKSFISQTLKNANFICLATREVELFDFVWFVLENNETWRYLVDLEITINKWDEANKICWWDETVLDTEVSSLICNTISQTNKPEMGEAGVSTQLGAGPSSTCRSYLIFYFFFNLFSKLLPTNK